MAKKALVIPDDLALTLARMAAVFSGQQGLNVLVGAVNKATPKDVVDAFGHLVFCDPDGTRDRIPNVAES